jgi:hypothetical protein
MTIDHCPKCQSKNFSTQLYSLNKKTGKKIDITGVKPSTNLLGFLVLIVFCIPAFLGVVFFFLQGAWVYVIITSIIGSIAAKFTSDTYKINLLLKNRTIEHKCSFCNTIWNDAGVILESHKPEIVTTISDPVEITQNAQASTPPTISEDNEKAKESKLCPRCYMDSKSLFICSECGYFDKMAGSVVSLLAIIGLGLGVQGLLAWIAGSNPLWAEIVKTLLCGIPGVLLVYWGISESFNIRKSIKWEECHKHDMGELLGFYERNPNASLEEAGKFVNHSGEWVQLMLNESKIQK